MNLQVRMERFPLVHNIFVYAWESLLPYLCEEEAHLHLFLSAMVCWQLYPPLSPAPSASISSSSGVAPPVIRDLIRVRAF